MVPLNSTSFSTPFAATATGRPLPIPGSSSRARPTEVTQRRRGHGVRSPCQVIRAPFVPKRLLLTVHLAKPCAAPRRRMPMLRCPPSMTPRSDRHGGSSVSLASRAPSSRVLREGSFHHAKGSGVLEGIDLESLKRCTLMCERRRGFQKRSRAGPGSRAPFPSGCLKSPRSPIRLTRTVAACKNGLLLHVATCYQMPDFWHGRQWTRSRCWSSKRTASSGPRCAIRPARVLEGW